LPYENVKCINVLVELYHVTSVAQTASLHYATCLIMIHFTQLARHGVVPTRYTYNVYVPTRYTYNVYVLTRYTYNDTHIMCMYHNVHVPTQYRIGQKMGVM